MVISIRVPDEDGERIKGYAVYTGVSTSELIRTSVQEYLDNEYLLTPQEWDMVRERLAYAEKERKKKRKKRRQKQKKTNQQENS